MPDADPESILDSTKQALGLDPEYKVYDLDIIKHINSVFSTLNRIGAGPNGGMRIRDNTSKWETFYQGRPELNEVETYVFLRVKLLFDPPTMGYLVNAIKDQIKEHEFSIQIMASNPDTISVTEPTINTFYLDPTTPPVDPPSSNFPDPPIYSLGDTSG